MLIEEHPKALLTRYGLFAKKSWGQNFLVDERAYKAIVAACAVGPSDCVIEIGAGLGTLTSRLINTGAQVIAVERERQMCDVLRTELSAQPNFTLREESWRARAAGLRRTSMAGLRPPDDTERASLQALERISNPISNH